MYKPFEYIFKKKFGNFINSRSNFEENYINNGYKNDVYESDWEELVKSVKPLKDKNYFWILSPKKLSNFSEEIELWPYKSLEIKHWLTSEYIEWSASFVSKETLRKLREGKFSIKRVLNIRGLTVEESVIELEEFFKKVILLQERCVLIVHGRGLSSKKEPVLKNLVIHWLRRGPFRRYVIAFCSARPCDGGLGATYVLLSAKPLKRK